MKQFTSKTQKIGKLGEDICAKFLMKQGHRILERNFTLKTGELDIVTIIGNVVHIVEVKSVSCDTNTPIKDLYNPLDNLHPGKLKRVKDTARIYLRQNSRNEVSHETKIQFDAYAIYVDGNLKNHRIMRIENI